MFSNLSHRDFFTVVSKFQDGINGNYSMSPCRPPLSRTTTPGQQPGTSSDPEDMSINDQDPIGSIPIAGEVPAGDPPGRTDGDVTGKTPSAGEKSTGAGQQPPSSPPPRPRRRRRRPRRLPASLVRTALIGIIALVLYLVGSWIAFPLIAPGMLDQSLEKRLDRPVTIARAEWRPFARQLVLHNGIVGPRKANPYDRVDPLLSFRTLVLDVSLFSLFRLNSFFPSLVIDRGYVHLVRDNDKGYNFPTPSTFTDSRLFPARLDIRNSRLEYTDNSHEPVFNGKLAAFEGNLQRSREQNHGLIFELRGRGPEKSALELQGVLRAGTDPGSKASLELHNLPLTALSAYLEPVLGGGFTGGVLNGGTEFIRHDDKLLLNQHFTVSSMELGKVPADNQALPLLQALLTDQGHQLPLDLAIALPLDRRDPPTYLDKLTAKLSDLLTAADDNPLGLLARQLPELEITGQIPFAPGDHTLSRTGGQNLDQMAAALGRRPLLTLHLQGISDPTCDLETLRGQKEQSVRQRLQQKATVLARQLTGDPGEPLPTGPSANNDSTEQPGGNIVGRRELLELAGQRQETVIRRLQAALEDDQKPRLVSDEPAIIAPPPFGERPCAAAVRLQPGYLLKQ